MYIMLSLTYPKSTISAFVKDICKLVVVHFRIRKPIVALTSQRKRIKCLYKS